MPWSDKVAPQLRSSVLGIWGISAVLERQIGGSAAITGIIQDPALAEDYVPGSVTGTTNVHFYVDFAAIDPPPRNGDTVLLDGVSYTINIPKVDITGGAVLRLKRNA